MEPQVQLKKFQGLYSRQILTKEYLTRKYCVEERSANQIAEEVGCSKNWVLKMMEQHKIERRQKGYAQHLRCRRNFNVSQEAKNYIDGLIISDCYVEQKSRWSARLYQGFAIRYKQWARKIKADLLRFGIDSKILHIMTNEITIKKTGQYISSFPAVILYTKHYEEFLDFRKRWYLNDTKTVPSDIEISASLIGNWHMGDGEYDLSTGRVGISIHSFSEADIKIAKCKLRSKLDIEPRVYPDRTQDNQPRFKFSRADSNTFLEYSKDWAVPCFFYKWGA